MALVIVACTFSLIEVRLPLKRRHLLCDSTKMSVSLVFLGGSVSSNRLSEELLGGRDQGGTNMQRELVLGGKRRAQDSGPCRHPNKSGRFCSLFLTLLSLHLQSQAPGIGTQRLQSRPLLQGCACRGPGPELKDLRPLPTVQVVTADVTGAAAPGYAAGEAVPGGRSVVRCSVQTGKEPCDTCTGPLHTGCML